MKLICCKDEKHWVDTINQWLAQQLEGRSSARLFVPAGETPRPLYRYWQDHQPQFLNGVEFVQLDEIITGPKKFEFRHFFKSELAFFQKQFCYIDDAEKAADLAILGLGVNGHVAFHEPGLGDNFYSGCLELNIETVKRLQLEVGARAVTYGVQAFMKADAILLIVRGDSKKKILREILNKKINVPATKLLSHPQFTIISDFEV